MPIPVAHLKTSPEQDWHKATSEYQKYVLVLPGGKCMYSAFETLELTQAYAEAQGSILIVPYTEWYTVPNLDDEGRPQPRPHFANA